MLHAGELYHRRDPRPLLDALIEPSAKNLPIQVDFVGRQTVQTYDLPEEIAEAGIARTSRSGRAGAVCRRLAADDAGRYPAVDPVCPDYHVGVPAKLYEYLGTGRPILALAELDSDIAWVLRESKVLHRIAPPLDVAQIARALVELTQAVQAGHAAAPDMNALHQFTRERMAQRVAECLDQCVPPQNAKGTP